MAKIKEYFKKTLNKLSGKKSDTKENNNTTDNTDKKNEPVDINSFKKKLLRHRRLLTYRAIAIGVFILLVIIGIYFSYKKRVFTDYTVLKTIRYTEVPTADYKKFNNNIVRYSTDGAFGFNMSNEMLWNQTYEMQNPIISIQGDYVAIGDYNGTKIYVMNSKGKQGEIDTTLPIHNFCVSGTGSVAVVLEENDVTWVRLFDSKGEIIASDRTTMAQSGYPVAIALSPNGSLLSVSYLLLEQGNVTSSVAFYNFGDVGQNEIDNLVSGYNYKSTVVSYLKFMNDKTSFAVGDNKFMIYKGTQKPESTFELDIKDEEIKSVFNNENYIGLVFLEGTSEASYRLDVYNSTGDMVFTKKFNLEYTDILLNNDMVVIYNSSECLMYSMDDIEKFNGNFKNSVIEMVPGSSPTRYLLVSGSKTEEIQLK
ncbi:MAG: DUF5711 family protein [Lachnospiraceae bacterium]|nr:DUF5711 family protein [Lachnospiraceae bacterium]